MKYKTSLNVYSPIEDTRENNIYFTNNQINNITKHENIK